MPYMLVISTLTTNTPIMAKQTTAKPRKTVKNTVVPTQTPETVVENTNPPAENTEITVTEVENTQPNTEAPEAVVVNMAPPIENAETTAKEEIEKPKTRYPWNCNLNPDQHEYVEAVFKARLENGLTTDRSHFISQVIDFAINHGYFTNHQGFALPPQHQYKLLKNGVCKNFDGSSRLTQI